MIATGLYAPEIGGPATYTKLLEEKLPPAGYEVSVVPFSLSRRFPKSIRHLHYFCILLQRSWSVDVVYAQDTVSVGLPALVVAKLLRKPFIIRVPGDYAWEQSVQRFGVTDSIDEFQLRDHGRRVKLLQSIQKMVVKKATLVITPSVYFQTLVGNWGVVPSKNVTIYNGVDLNIVPVDMPRSGTKLMVTAGRLVSWKGIDGLLTVLSNLPEWHLVIIGDGPDRGVLEQKANELGVSDRVQFTGSIPREQVFGWCIAADVFVLNTYFESFSYQVVEAMHSGTPVVVTNVGSLPELITHEVEGVLVTPDDMDALQKQITSVVSEPEVWRQRTAQAQKKVHFFTIEECMNQLDAKLKQLV